MRVLAFGTYQRDYPRFTQALAAMRRAGFEVRERHRDVWDGRSESWAAGATTVTRLAFAEAVLALGGPATGADVVYVGYPGHADLPAARLTARSRPVVFDPLVSLHDTLVGDRRRFARGSLAARALLRVDRLAFRAADLVVADTEAQADFYAASFGLERGRVAVCPVGADDHLFRPCPPEERLPPSHDALFVGKLIPLHGVDTILAAARLAPELRLHVVGDGQLRRELAGRPPNVTWTPWLAYEQLPRAYGDAAVALGIFGAGAKAARVVPNKAYQALATGTPLVTGDTGAARELLTDGVDALLVPPGDPAALAAALRTLARDATARASIGNAGRSTYERRAALPVLAERWRRMLLAVVR